MTDLAKSLKKEKLEVENKISKLESMLMSGKLEGTEDIYLLEEQLHIMKHYSSILFSRIRVQVRLATELKTKVKQTEKV